MSGRLLPWSKAIYRDEDDPRNGQVVTVGDPAEWIPLACYARFDDGAVEIIAYAKLEPVPPGAA